ncbi:unannotated protein [freshwater metagenome]|uniref:Unannotated protein n=1 Tax=freshwater metagenome TaxID=449393 RepID=A0A6J6LA59_9ZZZZ
MFTAVIVAGVLFLGNIIVNLFQGDGQISPDRVLRKIDLVASVNSIAADPNWSQNGSRTSGGQMQLALDDLRTISIFESTLVDDYATFPACTDFVTPNACVLLADMLGDAVVWFALVPADTSSGQEFLTLPGLIDMRDNGNEGVLRNGWVVNLTNGVRRECGDVDTSSLRDFITRFPDAQSTTLVNMITDNVVAVSCVQ